MASIVNSSRIIVGLKKSVLHLTFSSDMILKSDFSFIRIAAGVDIARYFPLRSGVDQYDLIACLVVEMF